MNIHTKFGSNCHSGGEDQNVKFSQTTTDTK